VPGGIGVYWACVEAVAISCCTGVLFDVLAAGFADKKGILRHWQGLSGER
jgi:hypothetical protein